ncbi:MAG: beta-galactosidase trimerization domain-containing protein [Acidobacteria bacterium]|nr:beta-galactosidase trimerization domain-containing protein [Acidobacteriota bacterium]
MKRLFFWLTALAALCSAQKRTDDAQWWTKEPLRIVHVITSLGKIDGIAAAELAEWKRAQGYNAEHLEVMEMHGGLDDQGFYFQSKEAGRVHPDFLKEYVAEAHRRGVRVIVYFNVHWYTVKFGERHPEWRQVRENGQPVDGVYENGTDFCLNTPWREWCFQILRDLASYGVDGIFYDGPVYRADSCYCNYCRAKYRAAHHEEMPSKRTRQGAAFQRLLDFQTASMAEFLRESRSVLRAANPGIAFYMNGGVRGANWATARLNRALIEHQDLLGSEGGFIYGDLTRLPMWKPGLTARLLETQASGKPTVIFSAAAHKPWTFTLLPEPEVRLLYADTIANNASVWMGITQFDMKQPEMKAVEAMNRFVAANGRYYTGSRSAANVAIVWSDTTANHYEGSPAQMIDIDRVPQRSAIGNVDTEFNGLAEALIRAQVPFDVIDDVTLERDPLERYGIIFLPNVACMSDAAAGRLKRFVAAGGSIFATFETSLYDETGVRRPDFALGSLFGVADEKKITGPLQWDFMKPLEPHWLLRGVEREMLAAPTWHARVRPNGGTVALRFTEPLKGRYDGIPKDSSEPALVANKVGSGTAVYFAGDLGAMAAGFHLPEYFRIVANAARRLSAPPFQLESVPGSVEVVWREQPGRNMLHLVNFTGEMTRPITQVVPLRDVRVTLPAPASYRRVHTLVEPRELPVTRTANGDLQVTLPRAAEYEVLVFEK